MNPGQKYVIRCTKAVDCDEVGLYSEGRYRKGDYITYAGKPTESIDLAYVYTCVGDSQDDEQDFFSEFPFDQDEIFDKHFEAVPIKLVECEA